MNMLIFNCPKSGAELVSGIRLDDRTCELVENLRVFLPCTHCRTTHQMRVKDGHYRIPDQAPLQPAAADALRKIAV
jgi:hypothetical protein